LIYGTLGQFNDMVKGVRGCKWKMCHVEAVGATSNEGLSARLCARHFTRCEKNDQKPVC